MKTINSYATSESREKAVDLFESTALINTIL